MKRDNHIVLFSLFLVLSVSICSLSANNLDSLVTHSLQFAQQQLESTVNVVGNTNRFPRSTLEDGSWKTKDAGSWASGFFPGCLWYMYEWTSDTVWKSWAEGWTEGMEDEQYDTGTHDTGFKIFCSYGNGYRLTGNEAYRDVILQGAQSLSRRFNSTVGCIRSWNNRTFPVIIDNMMNLEILFWASKNGGEPEWYDMALSHALRTIEDHVRDDGSTYQIVDYNPTTGEIVKKETHQGYTDESTWARGQAWGLYGFTMTYRETDSTIFLETAQRLADYYIENLPEDHVPYWDFNAPNVPNEEKDVSSAAIATSALLELSTLVPNAENKTRYQNAAFEILSSLCSDSYLAEGSNSSGILLHGVGNRNKGTEVDVSLIYADYYFLEAILRYMDLQPVIAVIEEQDISLPNGFELMPNYPNPFNARTTIFYFLPFASSIDLSIYDVTGRLVKVLKDGNEESGEYRMDIDFSNLPSGVYLLTLRSGGYLKTRKMTLIR